MQFQDKENPQRLQNILSVSLPIPYIEPLLSREHQTVTIMNLDIQIPGPKTGTQGEHPVTQLWQVTVRRIVKCISPINPLNGFLLVHPRLCARNGRWKTLGKCLVREIWI